MSKTFLASVVLLAAASAAAPAPASAADYRAHNWSKTQVILGGAPSALQATLVQQKALPTTAQRTLQPASYSRPYVISAQLRHPAIDTAPRQSGRPDVFGSVALPVTQTPLNARWRSVEEAPVSGAAARYAESLRDAGAIQRLDAVNRYVNQRVRFVDDQRQHGRPDVWSPATQTLSRGTGDCEDFAIAKLQMLRRAGLSDRDLYLVIVKDLVSRRDHAVLVVRTAQRLFVLDNGTDEVLESERLRDYRPILTFAANGAWTHGYRRGSARLTVASAEVPARTLSPAAERQRSRSASLLALESGVSK